MRHVFLCVCALALTASTALAQFDTAAVVGTVRDVSGGVVSGAQVTLTATETGISTVRTSTSDGNYEFAAVKPGLYVVTAEKPGFAVAMLDDVRVQVGARLRVDLQISPGQLTEKVEVSGRSLVETDSSQRGQVITGDQTRALPLISREYSSLALLTTGVKIGGSSLTTGNTPREGAFNVNGLRSTFNNFLIDGVDNNAYGTSNQGFSNQVMTRIHEETREAGIIEWLDSAFRDVRLGWRQLRRTPGLSLAVVLSLTIGIGANAALFSLVDAAILRPLPVSDPDSLRLVAWTNVGFPPGADNINGEFRRTEGGKTQSAAIPASVYRRLAREQTAFRALMGFGAETDAIAIATGGSPAEQVRVQYVSGNFFQGLGVEPVRGRPFNEGEDRVGAEPVVIVSHRYWRNHMEFVRGQSLEAIVSERGPFDSIEAANCIRVLAGALSAVHRARIVHNDVKAKNVLRETGGRVVLMDFGAGRRVQDPNASTGLTVVGTPLYMTLVSRLRSSTSTAGIRNPSSAIVTTIRPVPEVGDCDGSCCDGGLAELTIGEGRFDDGEEIALGPREDPSEAMKTAITTDITTWGEVLVRVRRAADAEDRKRPSMSRQTRDALALLRRSRERYRNVRG